MVPSLLDADGGLLPKPPNCRTGAHSDVKGVSTLRSEALSAAAPGSAVGPPPATLGLNGARCFGALRLLSASAAVCCMSRMSLPTTQLRSWYLAARTCRDRPSGSLRLSTRYGLLIAPRPLSHSCPYLVPPCGILRARYTPIHMSLGGFASETVTV